MDFFTPGFFHGLPRLLQPASIQSRRSIDKKNFCFSPTKKRIINPVYRINVLCHFIRPAVIDIKMSSSVIFVYKYNRRGPRVSRWLDCSSCLPLSAVLSQHWSRFLYLVGLGKCPLQHKSHQVSRHPFSSSLFCHLLFGTVLKYTGYSVVSPGFWDQLRSCSSGTPFCRVIKAENSTKVRDINFYTLMEHFWNILFQKIIPRNN